MAKRSGTIIAAEVTAATDQETFAYTDANFCRGGYHAYATLTERNAITPERRMLFAPVYVHETGKTYRLIGGMTNTHWVADPENPGGGGAEVHPFDVEADGIATTFQVNHKQGRQNLQISFRDVTGTPHKTVMVDWVPLDNNTIELRPDMVLAAGRIIRVFIS